MKQESQHINQGIGWVASLAEAWIETIDNCYLYGGSAVASLAEAWIETSMTCIALTCKLVASLAEAWIETNRHSFDTGNQRSPPSRRRGLKRQCIVAAACLIHVASLAEAWIETA